jgi:transglutaminase-like putative cysteine protease
LLFSLALVLNISTSSAASVNPAQINASDKSLASVGVATNISNYSTTNAKTNITKIANKTSNVTNQAAGAPVIVNGLTIAQLKDGISRAEAFYKKNHRLPAYISYGTRKIPIATFQKNIASQSLKINTTTVKTVPINTSSVAALAKSLSAGCTTDLQKATKIYNWVRDNINYAFYYNTKYGATGTLIKRLGNCCDTANLLVALARDAGIKARYVHGKCKFSSGNWYGHVWAQVYVNGKWVNADATSSRNSLGVIKNWNTATFKLAGIYNTLPF